ncbi:MAG: radical SAM family heme chaperone HemW [Gemmatimonadetes bacterium]|nr:radical SAM family heme chaperone HemW [Gemmatimonadota bacterium]MBT7861111.1 radical SAM family heme chaperone HemW [Gemmatimonadota bacterium]
MRNRYGLYVHIPFCPQRCPYCAFAVATGQMDQVDRYVACVCRELAKASVMTSWADRGPLDTVFFGGGTPSRIPPAAIGRILEAADRHLGLTSTAEITLEANPTTAESARFDELRRLGVNRLSIGVQSLQDETLRLLGRMHTAQEARQAFQLARDTDFDSINTDLIFSVPGESAGSLDATLEAMVELSPDHISAYALSVEEGTPFHSRRMRGQLPEVDEDDDAAAFGQIRQGLQAAGYEHYEISNYGRPGHRCQHNWDCWTGGEYLGVGLSAHSYVHGLRWWNTSELATYCDRMESDTPACVGQEPIGPQKALEERVWLGLRTCDGVELEPEHVRGVSHSVPLQGLIQSGRLELRGHNLRLIDEGFALADAVTASVLEQVTSGEAVVG